MFKVDGWVLATLMFQTLVFVYTNPDLDCDFRNGTCSWSQDDKNKHGQWLTGQSKYFYYGLHNKETYAYVDTYAEDWNTTQLRSRLTNNTVEGLISFVYYMQSSNNKKDTLNIYLITPLLTALSENKQLLWTMTGDQGSEWQKAAVCISSGKNYEVVIEAKNDGEVGDVRGIIAVADLNFTQHKCQVGCNFEYGFCGWRQQVDLSNIYWTRKNDTENDFVLHLESTNMIASVARLESTPVEYTGMKCFTFYYKTKRYHSNNNYSGILNLTLDVSDPENLIQMHHGNDDNRWQRAFLNINYFQRYKKFTIIMTASVARNDSMYIDNIKLVNGSCPMNCTFEEDVCGWSMENFLRTSLHQFNLSIGPWHDHTYTRGKGSYLYLISLDRKHSTLESIKIYMDEFQCLTFWYRMISYYGTKIEVYVQERQNSRLLKTFGNLDVHNNTWLPAAVEFEVPNSTIITFRVTGEALEYGEIGMDDIAVTPASCLDCAYHDVSCNWDGNFVWERNQNGVFSAKTDSLCKKNESVLTSRSEIFPGEKCLSFQYMIYGSISAYIQARSYEGIVLSSNWNTALSTWTRFSVSVDLSEKSRIEISLVHGRNCNGSYAIGNISLKQGQCQERPNDEQTTTVANKKTEVDNISEVAVDVIIAISIGGVVMIVVVFLVVVYCYRRKLASSTWTKAPKDNTVSNQPNSGASRSDTDNPNVRPSLERGNQMSETVHYNAHTEYTSVHKMRPTQNKTPHKSNDILYNTNEPVPDNTYNYTPELRDDTYDITSTCGKKTLDKTYDHTHLKTNFDCTYDHTHFKGNFDNTYDHTNFTRENTHDTRAHWSRQDFDQTYDHTFNDADEETYAKPSHALTENVDGIYDHT